MLQPKAFDVWKKRLPMTSGTRTAKPLFHAIQGTNRTRTPPQHRIPIAELFTRPIAYTITIQRLLVLESKSSNRLDCLVTPALLFKAGSSLDVGYGETKQRAGLAHLVESTGAFALYQFAYE